MPSLDVVAVGSAVIDHVYALSNLPEPDGGASGGIGEQMGQ